ncbi:MAG: 30S ribosomal protein S20, partial [Actinomycetota bacterium]|nr:30S ribosomal protein S20 [Actinomycetota bacterium]
KTQVKQFQQAVDAGDRDAAQEAYRGTARAYDKAASDGVIHKNKAANKKSRLAKQLSTLG